jgi:beta-xylosidase
VVFATNRDAGIEADADYLEGPWLERINGKYWLFYAATHRNENYQDWLGYWTCAAVADSVLGPYKKIAGVKLFMGGHASVFKSLNGGDWFCFRNESKGPDHGLLCIQSFYVDAFSKIIFPGSD